MNLFIGLLSYLSIGLLWPVYATPWDANCFETIPDAEKVATIRCIAPLFGNLVQGVLALSGVALFVMLLVGGFNFLLFGGDQKKLEMAKGTLTNAVIGLVVIVTAYLIIKSIEAVTGVTVTQFRLNF